MEHMCNLSARYRVIKIGVWLFLVHGQRRCFRVAISSKPDGAGKQLRGVMLPLVPFVRDHLILVPGSNLVRGEFRRGSSST